MTMYMIKKLIIVAFFSLLLSLPISVKAAELPDNVVVDKQKQWVIHFNHEIAQDNLLNQKITITDSKGNNVNVALKLGQDNKSVSAMAPSNGYNAGEKYKLIISNKICDKNGKNIKKAL